LTHCEASDYFHKLVTNTAGELNQELSPFHIFVTLMKNRFYLILISGLLLITVSYAQILHKVIVKENIINTVPADRGEESSEKSSEENTRETDQDEDAFRLIEMILTDSSVSLRSSKNEYCSVDPSGHNPEILLPPPQV